MWREPKIARIFDWDDARRGLDGGAERWIPDSVQSK